MAAFTEDTMNRELLLNVEYKGDKDCVSFFGFFFCLAFASLGPLDLLIVDAAGDSDEQRERRRLAQGHRPRAHRRRPRLRGQPPRKATPETGNFDSSFHFQSHSRARRYR